MRVAYARGGSGLHIDDGAAMYAGGVPIFKSAVVRRRQEVGVVGHVKTRARHNRPEARGGERPVQSGTLDDQ